MGESHQETHEPSQERGKSYIQWSPEENKTLINLLLDALASGLRDSNGTFSKFTVERRILPTLNRMHEGNKNHQHYLNRMKILKTKYLNAAELLRFSSGFGWDSTTKRFTAPKEVWAEYLKVKKSILYYYIFFIMLIVFFVFRHIRISENFVMKPLKNLMISSLYLTRI